MLFTVHTYTYQEKCFYLQKIFFEVFLSISHGITQSVNFQCYLGN